MLRLNEQLTILSWFWSQPDGRTQYTARHVNIWASMIRRHLSLPHRIACVTDLPDGIDPDIEIILPPRDFENVRIPTWHHTRPQCLRRISMFRPDAEKIFGKRFICMDLDCVIACSLDQLFDVQDDFKIFHGTAKGRLYNGSMILMTAGSRSQVYERFTPEDAAEAGKRFLGSDQAWISHVLGPGEATWGPEDGVHWYGSCHSGTTSDYRVMFYVGKVKPWELVLANKDSWVAENYRASARGPCLTLGHKASVWAEMAVAWERYGTTLPIIASREAAYYCDKVFAIADDDAQAERLACMYGYEPVWCGRTGSDA